MKVYIENNGKFVLLNGEDVYDNIGDYYKQVETINEAMDKLEEKKLTMEILHQKKGGYKVKKMGEYTRNRNVA